MCFIPHVAEIRHMRDKAHMAKSLTLLKTRRVRDNAHGLLPHDAVTCLVWDKAWLCAV